MLTLCPSGGSVLLGHGGLVREGASRPEFRPNGTLHCLAASVSLCSDSNRLWRDGGDSQASGGRLGLAWPPSRRIRISLVLILLPGPQILAQH